LRFSATSGSIARMRKLFNKYWWQILIVAVNLFNFFGWSYLPATWREAVSVIFPLDLWLVKHTPSITVTIILISLLLGAVIIPDCWEIIKILFKKPRAINNLWKLREEGAHHRNMHINVSSPEQYQQWDACYRDWRLRVLKEAKIVSMSLWNRINVLDSWNPTIHPVFMSPFINAQFQIDHQIASETLRRITTYLEEHE
jgi:hypothetical protein